VAQAEAVVRLEPSSQQLAVGQATTVDIRIENVTDLVAAALELRFDPAILQAQDGDPARAGIQLQPGDPRLQGFVAQNEIDNTTGLVRYTTTQLAPFDPVNGDLVLATLLVQAAAPGTSNLSFGTTLLTDSQVRIIPVTTEPGQITVGPDTGQPTATFTPISTLAPGQPTPTFTPIPPVTLTLVPGFPTSTLTPTPSPTPSPSLTPTPLPPTPTFTPIPPITKIPPGATVGFCYRVRPKESLHEIAAKFGLSPAYLNQVNDLYPPGYVVVNQPLFIPEQPGHGPNVYIARPGDTLAGVADACGFSADILARANDLDREAIIQPGHVLFIPIPPFPNPSRYIYPAPGVGGGHKD
jgi:LysM repeat protein